MQVGAAGAMRCRLCCSINERLTGLGQMWLMKKLREAGRVRNTGLPHGFNNDTASHALWINRGRLFHLRKAAGQLDCSGDGHRALRLPVFRIQPLAHDRGWRRAVRAALCLPGLNDAKDEKDGDGKIDLAAYISDVDRSEAAIGGSPRHYSTGEGLERQPRQKTHVDGPRVSTLIAFGGV